ncbi:MAG: carboxypeptidase regulatory-like domain-containing protein, partial [Planctomycetes bacterium]|nr:carboxypeptidase regulatory-like domain-containing protein [Planctomycetota bacterium]
PHQPLVVALQRGGTVSGRVVDAAGVPISAHLMVRAERGGPGMELLQTANDGTFRIALRHPGRYRVAALDRAAPGFPGWDRPLQGWVFGPMLEAPKDGITIELANRRLDRAFELAVVDAKTGVPVSGAHGVARWNTVNGSALGVHVTMPTAGRDVSVPGRLVLPGPAPGQPARAALLVKAPGYAPTLLHGVHFDPQRPDARSAKVELQRECVVAGTVVDERGKPLPGARIRCFRQRERDLDPSIQAERDADSRTDARGAFRIEQLAEGEYELSITHPARPPAAPVAIRLGTAEHKAGIVVRMPRGVMLRGRVKGEGLGGCRVRLDADPGFAWGINPRIRTLGGATASGHNSANGGTARSPIPLAADGGFAFHGLHRGAYSVVLERPRRDGTGTRHEHLLGRIVVADQDLSREFDAALHPLGSLHGTVVFRGVALPRGRLLLRAEPAVAVLRAPSQPPELLPEQIFPLMVCATCLPESDGRFAMQLPKGNYFVCAYDLATGLRLLRADAVVMAAGGRVERKLAIELGAVRV